MRSTFAPIQKYIGTGVLAQYGFDFKIEDLSQLLLVVLDATGVEVQRLRGNVGPGYYTSITFDPENGGGTVNLAANLPSGYEMYLYQANDAPTQPSEFRDKNNFSLRSFERALDFITGAIQRVSWMAQRSIRLNDGYDLPFNMQLPKTLIPTASIIIGADGLSLYNGPTIAQLAQANQDAITASDAANAAAASAAVAATKAAEALASADAAALSSADAAAFLAEAQQAVVDANTALTAALAAQTAAEAAYAAAVVTVVGALGFVSVGPFVVNASSNVDLAGQTIDHTVYRAVDFIATISSPTDATIRSRIEFSLVWNGTNWVKLDGPERHSTTIGDVAFTMSDTATAQLNAANNGASNVQIILTKIFHAA